MRWLLTLLLLLPLACAPETDTAPDTSATADPAFESPAALINAMRARYDGQWYGSLTFVQETIQYNAEGVADTATWYEAYRAPGKLRIDFAPLENGNGVLFADDMRYNIQNGEVAASGPGIHPLLLLGFDVYHLPAEETLWKLDTLGFDMTKMVETTWQGRPAYLVGATREDEAVSRFWIDKEHLYFTRMVRYVGPEGTNVQDVYFNKYERLGGGWIAPEVIFDFDGRRALEETYRDMRTGVEIDTTHFDPAQWRNDFWSSDMEEEEAGS